VLTATELRKSFGSTSVLRDIDLCVECGTVTALVGPSGAGKTTLLRAVAMIDPPDSGAITLDDFTYTFPREGNSSFLLPWPKITVVFQQLFLWPHLTLRQNITLPLRYRPGTNHQDLAELYDLFQITKLLDRYPNRVSAGERQRVALIRALALNPSYLLLDEVTSALDVEQAAVILSHLGSLRSRGIGVLLVTHHLHFASEVADRILFIDHGAVLAQGGPSLLTKADDPRVRKFVSAVETVR